MSTLRYALALIAMQELQGEEGGGLTNTWWAYDTCGTSILHRVYHCSSARHIMI